MGFSQVIFIKGPDGTHLIYKKCLEVTTNELRAKVQSELGRRKNELELDHLDSRTNLYTIKLMKRCVFMRVKG